MKYIQKVRFRMRIPIAWQLALLVMFTSLVVLAVISIATVRIPVRIPTSSR
jgi:hypothetical protein